MAESKDENEFELETEDPLTIEDISGPWCSCLPPFMSMGFMTGTFAILGFLFGALMYEVDIKNTFKKCYSGTDSTEYDNTCILELMIFPGNLWVRALKCLIVPLMVTMMLTLPERVRNIEQVGSRILCMLIFTSFVAAMEGLTWSWIFQPGKGVDYDIADEDLADDKISELESFLNIFDLFVPSNIVQAMYGVDILAIIAVFTVYGIEINKCPPRWKYAVLDVAKAILRATLALLVKVMWFTPIAMFSLISYHLAKTDDLWKVFGALGKYVGCQLLGQFIHLVGFYFTFYFLATFKNPVLYFLQIKEAPITALITSSSAATMPVTLRVNYAAGNHKDLVKFCIPLGAGMNMDGTSLGFPIMVMFTAQMVDHDVSSATQFTVALLAMVCSMGTAPVPNAGLVFLTMLFVAAEIPDDSQGLGYALISVVDWLIDRVETAQNVTSDSFLCGILSHYYESDNKGCLNFFMKDLQISQGEGISSGSVETNMAKDSDGRVDL